ncbi:MAG: DNA repair protein RecO [Patescibacteria group bacterium]
MYRKHHTRGIIIWSKIESSDSRRANIFTENFGLINARVQGARNLHSKLRAGSQDFSFGDFSLVHGKSGWRVVSVRSEKNLFEIFRKSPEKLNIVGNILSLIKKLVAEEEAHTNLFDIIAKLFKFLEKAKESDIALAECLTLVRILHCLGYMRHDSELIIPLSSSEIEIADLETIAPRRAKIVNLINESLKAT